MAIGDFLSNLGTYLTPNFTAGPDQDCGSVTTSTGADPDSTGDDTVVALSGTGVLGCGLLSIGIAAGNVTNYVADLGIKVELSGGQFTVTPAIPDDLVAKFAAAALDLRLHPRGPAEADRSGQRSPCAPAARPPRATASCR